MGSAMTDWGTGQFLAICLGISPFPSVFYAALVTDEPGTDIDGDILADFEPDPAAGYVRVAVPTGILGWSDPQGMAYSATVNPVDFGVPTGDWGAMSHFALCDAATGGNVWLYGEFDIPPELVTGTGFAIPAGGVIIAFSSFAPSIVAV